MQAEAEEAERRARIQQEIKKTLTSILLNVTDGLFGEQTISHRAKHHQPVLQKERKQCNVT